MASVVYRRSTRRTWFALLGMVVLLTAIGRIGLSPSIGWALSMLVVVAAVYWAMRGI